MAIKRTPLPKVNDNCKEIVNYLFSSLMTYDDFIFEYKSSIPIDENNKIDNAYMTKDSYNERLRESLNHLIRSCYKTEAKTIDDAMSEIINELHQFSLNVSVGQWRKMRRSLVVLLLSNNRVDLAKRIQVIKNEVPTDKRVKKKGREQRVTTVTKEMLAEVVSEFESRDDQETLAAIKIAEMTGCRLCEITKVELMEETEHGYKIFIQGAKKTLKGEKGKIPQRGLDRTFYLKLNDTQLGQMRWALNQVSDFDYNKLKAIAKRISDWQDKKHPTRKKRFCFHSLRYTFGSNLKKAYKGKRKMAKIIAAIMGHASTESQEDYGNARYGTSFLVPIADPETVSKVREHTVSKKHQSRVRETAINKLSKQKAATLEFSR